MSIMKGDECFMKFDKFKIDPAKALSLTVTALGVVGTLLASKVQSNDRKAMKAELKDELLKELTQDK